MSEQRWKITQVDDEAWALLERQESGWVELAAIWNSGYGGRPWNAQVEGTDLVSSHATLKEAQRVIEGRITTLRR